MILYATPLSSYSLKVRLALAYKGVAVELRSPPGGYRSQAYRELVPMATVPALVDGGFVLSESDAIIEYLDECHPAPPLLPGDAKLRAQARMLSRLHDFRIEPPIRALFREISPATRDPAAVEQRFAAFAEAMALVGEVAKPGPFLCGEVLTLADCAFPATLILARHLGAALGVAITEPGWFRAWDAALRAQARLNALLRDYETEIAAWIRSRQEVTTLGMSPLSSAVNNMRLPNRNLG